jgi:hypothetical protein
MATQILTIITGTSSVIGLLSLLAYLFYSYRIREIERSKRSIKEAAEGEGLFNSDQIVQIIREFKDDSGRLDAIKQFANVQNKSGDRIYNKIKGNIDIVRLETTHQRTLRKGSLAIAIFFVVLGGTALLSTYSPFEASATSETNDARLLQIGTHVRVFDFTDWNDEAGPNSKVVLIDKLSLKRLDSRATHFELVREIKSERSDVPPLFSSPTYPIIIIPPQGSDYSRYYRIVFDISREPLNQWVNLQLTSTLWDEFHWFTGENVDQKIEYPTDRLQFEFRSPNWTFTRINRYESPNGGLIGELDNKSDPSFVLPKDQKGFTWTIDHPKLHYHYHLLWWLGHIMFTREPDSVRKASGDNK